MADNNVRQQILSQATRLFAQKGYGSTSVREVVEAAGVTKPTLYYYFASKEALFLEVVNVHLRNLEGLVTHAVEGPGTVRERLEGFVERYIGGALENRDAVKLLMTLQHPSERDQPAIDIMSMHLRKIELLGALLREGIERGELRPDVDPTMAVLALIGIVNLHCMACLHGFDVDQAAPGIIDLFFDGVGS